MRFVFIQAHERIHHVTTMCRLLEVSRAGYYKWRAAPLAKRVTEDAVLTARIRALHTGWRRAYGSPRVHRELRDQGTRIGKKRVARLMRAAALRATAPRRYRSTTRSEPGACVAPNELDRQFAVEQQPGPDRVWVADITYLPTREGWLYLAILLDLATRRIVGWSAGVRLDQELALGALRMALQHRRPLGGIHHSDRGVQYGSATYQQLLGESGFVPSMSRRGNCWDNAVAESFFGTLTKELLGNGPLETRAAGLAALFEFIEVWYNRQRKHSSLGYRSPAEFEATLTTTN